MAFTSFQGGAANTQPLAEINTTPLVDVMLVLLVIFIITAPLFHQAVPVDLPNVDSTRLQDPPAVIQLALDKAGQVFINGQVQADKQLDQALLVLRGEGAIPELHFRADRQTPYERVAKVMAAAQKAGLNKIAFVTLPNTN